MPADVSQTADLIRRHALALASAATLDVEYETKVAAPEDTGELVNSVHGLTPQLVSGSSVVTILEAWADHAIFVVGGTQPHVIRATKSHGLLVWNGGGGTVFAYGSVNHPGTQPNTQFWSEAVLQERWTRALEDATRSVVTVG
jgi:hypothetical protein